MSDTTNNFLRALFRPYGPNLHLFVEIRCWRKENPEKTIRRFRVLTGRGLRDAADLCDSLAPHGNVTVGVYPRGRKAGYSEDVAAAGYLYADADTGASIPEGTPKPNIITSSGSGAHWYWRLAEPVLLDTEESRERVRRLLQRLDRHVKGGHCYDLARVLRAPGSLNHKYDPPRPVTVTKLDLSGPQTAEWWERFLPDLPPNRQIEQHYRSEPELAGLSKTFLSRLSSPAAKGERNLNIRNYGLHIKAVTQDMNLVRGLLEQYAQLSGYSSREDWAEFERQMRWIERRGNLVAFQR
jgi:hypothetical protein